MGEQTNEKAAHPTPPGPPGPPTHEHADGARCMWVRHNFIDRWRLVGASGRDLGPCPGFSPEKAYATPGEAYYVEHGWSGCAGSAWSALTQATRDGWEAAARERALRTSPGQDAS